MICRDLNQRLAWLEDVRYKMAHSVNLGCGTLRFDNSINCDLTGEGIDIRLDARTLPFHNDSLDMIEAHHLLEHFSYLNTDKILNEWRRCLKNDGLLIISVPNCEVMFALALSRQTKSIPAKEKWGTIIRFIFGNQEHEGQYHKAGFAPEQLRQILIDNKFEIKDTWHRFPNRPTPSFCIIAKKQEERQ